MAKVDFDLRAPRWRPRQRDRLPAQPLRSVLVVGEVALALVLLSGAGLLMRSFYQLQAVDPGFDPHGLLTFRTNLPAAKYKSDESQAAFLFARAGAPSRPAGRDGRRCRADLPALWERLHSQLRANRQTSSTTRKSAERCLLRGDARIFRGAADSAEVWPGVHGARTPPPHPLR
jgi:hypothetical protein